MKRELPMARLKKQIQPLIALTRLDAYEKVTEFRSVGGYYGTLRKWQAMDVPMMRRAGPNKAQSATTTSTDAIESVFEKKFDTLASPDAHRDDRWRFKGPWVGAQPESEFLTFLERDVRNKRAGFQEYMRAQCAAAINKKAKAEMFSRGVVDEAKVVTASDVTDEQFDDFMRQMRADRRDLFNYIRTYFDLPPRNPQHDGDLMKAMDGQGALSNFLSAVPRELSNSPYASNGPPKTHPSAGMYYTRTPAVTPNHFLHGPLKDPLPVLARVMPTQRSKRRLLGVAGFIVAADTVADFDPLGKSRYLKQFERQHGGEKSWVTTSSADVQPDGKIMLRLRPAHDASVDALTEDPRNPKVKPKDTRDFGGLTINKAARPPGMGRFPGTSYYGIGN